MGKVTDASLEALGAKRVFELGLGDDDGSLEVPYLLPPQSQVEP